MKLAYSLLLGIFFIGSACHDDEEPEDQTKQKTKVSYQMQELKHNNASIIKGLMSKSNDHKFVYITSSDNQNLYAIEIANKQITPLTISSKIATPEVVAKADLSLANKVNFLYPTDTGVMATVTDNAGATVGVAEFVKADFEAKITWKLTEKDSIFSAAAGANDTYKGFMAYKKNGNNLQNAPYILSTTQKGFFTVNAVDASNTKLANISKRDTTDLDYAKTHLVAHKSLASAYLIDKLGIADIAPANINTNTNIAKADNFSSFNLKKDDNTAGTDKQTDISFVSILADKIFVAFNASNANQGGVAIIELNADGTLGNIHAPNHAWGGKSILNLTHDGTIMYAVMADNIVAINADASIGADLNQWLSVNDLDNNKILQGNITHAEITNDELFIATDAGLFNSSKKTLTKTKIK